MATNQEVINALHGAAAELGLANRWELLERAGLSLEAMATARNAIYAGPPLAKLPNLTAAEVALVVRQATLGGPPFAPFAGRTTSDLNLRSGAGRDQPVIEVLPSGTPVQVDGEDGDWLHVSANNRVGFVHRDFVVRGAANAAPAAFCLPFEGSFTITQPFGFDPTYPVNNGWHFGIDYGCPIGTPIVAAAAGVVVEAGTGLPRGFASVAEGAWGRYVQIDHGNGLHTGYAHLNEILVNLRDNVAQGQRIGMSGNTGLTTGPHLHFQCIRGTSRTNPSPFLA